MNSEDRKNLEKDKNAKIDEIIINIISQKCFHCW